MAWHLTWISSSASKVEKWWNIRKWNWVWNVISKECIKQNSSWIPFDCMSSKHFKAQSKHLPENLINRFSLEYHSTACHQTCQNTANQSTANQSTCEKSQSTQIPKNSQSKVWFYLPLGQSWDQWWMLVWRQGKGSETEGTRTSNVWIQGHPLQNSCGCVQHVTAGRWWRYVHLNRKNG